MHLPGDSDAPFRAIHEQYASRYNGARARNDVAWGRALHGDPYRCESYRYILSMDGLDMAYCVFRPIKLGDNMHDMQLTDFAYREPESFRSLLGFLYRFAPQYQRIRFEAPSDLHPSVFLPESGVLRVTGVNHVMARVVDVPRALRLMRHPEGTGAYRIAVEDGFMPENNRTYGVCYGPDGVNVQEADALEERCDIRVSVQAFAQLCFGFCALPAALLRPDVRLYENRETLEKVFIEKPRLHSDRY